MQGLDDAPGRDVPITSELYVECLAALIVAGLKDGMLIDSRQCPPRILELHLYVFLLLRVDILFALPLAERRAILVWLLHLFV
jgi:hypothetical protein